MGKNRVKTVINKRWKTRIPAVRAACFLVPDCLFGMKNHNPHTIVNKVVFWGITQENDFVYGDYFLLLLLILTVFLFLCFWLHFTLLLSTGFFYFSLVYKFTKKSFAFRFYSFCCYSPAPQVIELLLISVSCCYWVWYNYFINSFSTYPQS